jgi:hypothetical protein
MVKTSKLDLRHIKMELEEIGFIRLCTKLCWLGIGVQWRALVNTAMNLWHA